MSGFTTDEENFEQLVFRNCKLERFRYPNSAGNDSYRLSYDRIDKKTGKTFRWVAQTIDQNN